MGNLFKNIMHLMPVVLIVIVMVCAFGTMAGAVEGSDIHPITISAEMLEIRGKMTMTIRQQIPLCKNRCRRNLRGVLLCRPRRNSRRVIRCTDPRRRNWVAIIAQFEFTSMTCLSRIAERGRSPPSKILVV